MTALSVQVPYPVFYDRNGAPLDNGNIYIGVANLDPVTNPLQVYYDEALTLTASQPLITSNGYVYRNGTPAQLYVNAVNFSILVNDSKNLLVYNFPDGTGIPAGTLDQLTLRSDSANIFQVQQANSTNTYVQSSLSAYSGTGTATAGAPRIFLGTNASQNDDSAICVGRGLVGTGLFSHAFRDESTFVSNADSAYTAFDARFTINSNSGVKYNHSYSFQASHQFSATNGIDLFAGFLSNMRVTAGTVDRLFHFHAQAMTLTGGAVLQHVGFHCGTLTGGAGTNYAFFAQTNPCFFGGDVQMNLGNISGFTEVKGQVGTFTGSVTAFNAAGGIFIGGNVTSSGYGAVRAYNDGSGAVRGLALNYTGGQVLINAGSPVTGEQLEVVGTIGTSENYRVDGVQVVGNQGAAVADATDAATAITQLNALLARLRTHGLIAT